MSASETLDLSRLPAFSLVDADYEAILAARKLSLVARCAELGIPYNVENLETDGLIIPQQEDAHRELLDKTNLNDAGRGLTIAYGWGARLDQIAATYFADIGIRRMAQVAEPRPFSTHPEDWEDDDRFRRRVNLASEARSPYTAGAYVYAALSASILVTDAVALNHESGIGLRQPEIKVVILGAAGADEDALVTLVRETLLARHIKPATDVLIVAKARRVSAALSAMLRVRRGPDPALVRTEALRKLDLYRADRRRVGLPIANSGLDAALHVGGVEEVTSTFITVDPGPDGVVELTPITVTTETPHG